MKVRSSAWPGVAWSADTWYVDEVFIAISDKRYYLWRAVDQDAEVLDIPA